VWAVRAAPQSQARRFSRSVAVDQVLAVVTPRVLFDRYRERMMFRVLGPLEVIGSDGPVPVGGPVPRRILTALLAQSGSVVSVDSLIEAAWGDKPPASAERTLLSHLTRLREALGGLDATEPARVERRGGGYLVSIAADALDVDRFERSLRQSPDLPATDAIPALREALALWRPPAPYADLQDTAYPAAQAARLVELYGAAVEALVAAYLEAGEPAAAAAEARGRLHDDPYREGLWEALVLALYRQGRQADALEAFRRARTELRDGLGVDPGPRLRELEAQILAQDPRLLVVTAPARHACPYKGLARYDEADAGLFVGRERLVDDLLARLVDGRFVVVAGPSGAGKSSLVRAGLVPALSGGALPGSGGWSVIVIVPGAEPLPVIDDALAARPDVLIVDQAEEALLADDGTSLIAVGDRLLAASDAGTRVVLAVRADFYGLLSRHPVLARRAGPATVLVGPPDENELRRIVVEPAARMGLRVEPALANLILAEIRDRPGGLPVLSTALVRTWEHREGDTLSVTSYHAGGGVEAALERVGEEAWASFDDDEQRTACRRILLRLAVNEDGSWVRRWMRRTELVHSDDRAAAAALAVLTDRRLVVARADDLGIAHEALLTGWPRLRGWLEDGRARAAVLARLAVTTSAWEQSDRDPAELYRGTRLQAALDTAAANPDDLAPLEREFLAESAREVDRQLSEQRARADREARGRRRARIVATSLAITLAFAGSAGTYAITQQRRAQQAAQTARQAALAADADRLGALARSGGDYDRALLLAAQAVTLNPSPATESDLFATLLRGDAVVRARRAPARVSALTFSPDRNSILALTTYGPLVRWSARDASAPTTLTLGDGGRRLEVAADGTLVVDQFSSVRQWVDVVEPLTGRVINHGPNHGDPGEGGWALSADGRIVVFAPEFHTRGWDTDVVIWRIGRPASETRRVNVGASAISLAACLGRLMCVLTSNQRIVRIDPASATVQGSFAVPPDTLNSLQASPDGRTLAIVGVDGIVRLLEAQTGREVRTLGGPTRDPRVLGFSPDGHQIAVGDSNSILVWRTDAPGFPQRYEAHGGRVLSAAWSADSATLVTGAEDGTVIEWDTTGRHNVGAVLNDDLRDDTSTLWATPGAIIVGQFGGRLLFVDPADGSLHPGHWTVPGFGIDTVLTARTGVGSHVVVTADRNGRTAVWDARTRKLLGTVDLPATDGGTYAPDTWVSPDGTRAATIRNSDGPIVFDVATRTVTAHLQLASSSDTNQFISVQGWSADGRSLLVSRVLPQSGNDLLVLDALTGQVRLRLPFGKVQVGEVTADPTGRYLAVGMSDGTLRIIDAHDGHALAPPLKANSGAAFNVSISPNGRYLSVSGFPPAVTLWDARTFRQVAGPLPLDVDARDARARFAPDGRLVVTSGPVLRAFVIDPSEWLARACREAGRTLTRAEWEEVLPSRPYAPACA
jgi:DNA-binding SARP family transcriptional activator/WD40 repeat protein